MHTLSPVLRRFKLSTDAHRQRKIPVCVGIIAVWLCGFHLSEATISSVSDYSIGVWQTEQGLSLIHICNQFAVGGRVEFDGPSSEGAFGVNDIGQIAGFIGNIVLIGTDRNNDRPTRQASRLSLIHI